MKGDEAILDVLNWFTINGSGGIANGQADVVAPLPPNPVQARVHQEVWTKRTNLYEAAYLSR